MNFYPAWLGRDLITDFVVMEGYHSAYEAALYLIGNNKNLQMRSCCKYLYISEQLKNDVFRQ
ncbi:hypothetical protein APP_04850 [Aeribacillus pallidus]|nr:hypothetical protein APP_04850 [Aeribacillus pallidus]